LRKVFFAEEMRLTPFQRGPDRAGLKMADVTIVDRPEDADVICGRTLSTIAPFLGLDRSFLIWTDEPAWCGVAEKSILDCATNRVIHVSTAFNNEVYFTPLHHFPFAEVDRDAVLETLGARPKFCSILATYRARFDRYVAGRNVDISEYRQRLALHLHKAHAACDIFGRNWPAGIEVVEESRGTGWQDRKMEILADYQFNIGCENTIVENYVTEKIWQSILAGTVTVYFARGTGVEKVVKPESYIDPADFADADALHEHMRGLSLVRRVEIARSALDDYEKILSTYRPAQLRLLQTRRFEQRLHEIC
jgi:hypothetical protein